MQVLFCQNYPNMLQRMLACDGCGPLLKNDLSIFLAVLAKTDCRKRRVKITGEKQLLAIFVAAE